MQAGDQLRRLDVGRILIADVRRCTPLDVFLVPGDGTPPDAEDFAADSR